MDISPKFGFSLPTQPDPFRTADYRANFEAVDAAPGSFICTSGTRPSWGAPQAGRKIFETNTGLEWWWNGAAFHRVSGSGLLMRSDGTVALARLTGGQIRTNSTAYVMGLALTQVVVPDGARPLRVEAIWTQAATDSVPGYLSIFRSAVANSGSQLGRITVGGNNPGPGGSYSIYESAGLSAGVYNYSIQVRSTATSSYLTIPADSAGAVSLSVTEL